MVHVVSPFLDPGPRTRADSLAIVQLSRDQFQPVYLQDAEGAVDGYAEGAVLNTRFGSFPHSTLIDVPWGSLVRASVVDTGSRGRKRKRTTAEAPTPEAASSGAADTPGGTETPETETPGPTSEPPQLPLPSSSRPPSTGVKQAVTAASGFVHILPPTPEIWTLSLPHRTQVVYTADYSYILHRLRARPGTRLIEAGSGSGSFTHAAARAVYGTTTQDGPPTASNRKTGRVFSFEFHNARYRAMRDELASHGLDQDGLVTLTNRDVYADGFLVEGDDDDDDGGGKNPTMTSPEADAVFLDLPAPWRALPHLTRGGSSSSSSSSVDGVKTENNADAKAGPAAQPSPLNPNKSVYLCTFSPCIEQVTRTVAVLRRLGWVDLDVVEIAQKKILVQRETVGNGAPPPRDVEEAVARLQAIETRTRAHNQQYWREREAAESGAVGDGGDGGDGKGGNGGASTAMDVDSPTEAAAKVKANDATSADGGAQEEALQGEEQQQRQQPQLAQRLEKAAGSRPWMEGRLTTRVEPEIKTHTSYLVFAVLPRAWTAADEAAAAARWPCGNEQGVIGAVRRDLRKEQKRQQMQGNKRGKV